MFRSDSVSQNQFSWDQLPPDQLSWDQLATRSTQSVQNQYASILTLLSQCAFSNKSVPVKCLYKKLCSYSIQCSHGRVHWNPQRRKGDTLWKLQILYDSLEIDEHFTGLGAKEGLHLFVRVLISHALNNHRPHHASNKVKKEGTIQPYWFLDAIKYQTEVHTLSSHVYRLFFVVFICVANWFCESWSRGKLISWWLRVDLVVIDLTRVNLVVIDLMGVDS